MADDPLLGRQLANFRIERPIGRGGMGQVYYGQDVQLQRPVAIKVIDARFRDDPVYAERFVREARAVAAWRHENIVQIYYAGEQDGLYYFVMEYIDGPDLGQVLARYAAAGKLLPNAEVLRVGRAIASALDYAHRNAVVHRDVKPSNVICANDGRVVLTDFGLALDVQHDALSEVSGTPHYIAPEQAHRSTDAVPQSDLYSLGVILYEMLTGVVPFDDLSPATVALQHMTLPPPSPREINPKINVDTERVLLRALNKSPEKRYTSGMKLIDALEKVLPAGRAASARRTLRESPASPTRARPAASPSDAVSVNLVGQQLDEYRLDALLGQGGMARIYRAYDTQRKRHAAIKVIDARFRADPEYVKRFQREARAIGQLDHPNIVKLYRYGEANGQLYIAMQYVEGADLHSTLAARRAGRARLRPEETARIVRDVCLALDYAHGKGVIHRDVKPSNIILDKKGHALLTDFGLALLAESGTRGEIFGSPHYIAPEQAMSSARATPQSDLYAIGVTLYEIFTGQVPFDAQDPLDIALLHMTEPPRPPSALRKDISPELEAVILKALAKEPDDRYPTGAVLADALDRALRSASKKATPASPPAAALPPIPAAVAKPARQTRTTATTRKATSAKLPAPAKPQKRKRRAILALIGIALFLIVVSAGAVWWTNQNQSQATSVAGSAASPTSATSALEVRTQTRTASPSPSATPSATSTSRPTAKATATRAALQPTLAVTLTSTSPVPATLVSGPAATAESESGTVWLPLIMRNYTIP